MVRWLSFFGLLMLLMRAALATPGYVGSAQCISCHAAEAKAWRGSHHELAMAEASDDKVLGDFNNVRFTAHGITSRFYRKDGGFFVRTDGPDGKLHDYRIKYTFGWTPLQQYLIEFPNGHIQALGIAWDSSPAKEGGQRWFHLYPKERMDHRHPQHWTARSQTWNHQCAECHSTDLQKNYDLAGDRYRTTWSEINVACEACHGPGERHVGWARTAAKETGQRAAADKGLVFDVAGSDRAGWMIDAATGKPRLSQPGGRSGQVEVCARCHSRRGPVWEGEADGRALGKTHRLALLDESLYYPDGQIKDEVYEYGSFVQSKMHAAGVACSNCHEPHSLKLRAEGNALCASCHLPARYDVAAHHHHVPGTAGAACTSCHMPQRLYMVNDWRADHSMRVPRPDLSSRLGTPDACTGCHVKQSSDWAARAVAKWYPDSKLRGPHFGEALRAASVGAPDAASRLLAVASDKALPPIVRASAASRLSAIAGGRDWPATQPLLADEQPLVRAAALRFLDVADAPIRFQRGWPLLRDPERTVRLEAARLLAPLLGQRLPPALQVELQRAVGEYEQSQRVNADLPTSHVNLGLLAVTMGDGERAEQAYRTALRLDPSFSPGYANLADLYRQQQRDTEGEQVLRRGIDSVADDADLRYSLGLLLIRQKRLGEALPVLRQATEAEPEGAQYAYAYALALHAGGDRPGALRVLRRANARNPADRQILLALATLSRDEKDLARARTYAEELLRRFPDDPQARALQLELRGG